MSLWIRSILSKDSDTSKPISCNASAVDGLMCHAGGINTLGCWISASFNIARPLAISSLVYLVVSV